MTDSKAQWDKVVALNIEHAITLGPIYSEFLLADPKCFGFVLSRYKFAAKMLKRKRRLVEIGCGEGIGAMMLIGETGGSVLGIDFDARQIAYANENLVPVFERHKPAQRGRLAFECRDFTRDPDLGERFDGLVCVDVIEHVPQAQEDRFLAGCRDALTDDGVAIIGTPNDHASPYASERSQIGHINLFTPERYQETLERHFRNVFIFSMNDEVVHTGYDKMAHYLMALCVK